MENHIKSAQFIGGIDAAADYMAPGAIEINRYESEIIDLVRRRGVLGQRIQQTPATGHPSRWFEQLTIPTGGFMDPRTIAPVASQPVRQERAVLLKALAGQINYGLFDVEVNQQQGQFAYLEAKDLADLVDGLLKVHDQALWTGTDTDLIVPQTTQYYGLSGQIINAAATAIGNGIQTIAATGSIANGITTAIAALAARQDYEVRPSGIYMNPTFSNLLNIEAKAFLLYFNSVEIMPGVVVKALPTDMGELPIITDPFLTNLPAAGGLTQYTTFILSEDLVEYHYLTDPLPRVFQLGLLGNLAAQYVTVKFGAPVAKAAPYAHIAITATR